MKNLNIPHSLTYHHRHFGSKPVAVFDGSIGLTELPNKLDEVTIKISLELPPRAEMIILI